MPEPFNPELLKIMKSLNQIKNVMASSEKRILEHLILMDNSRSFGEAVAKYEALKLRVKELEKRQPWQVFINPDKRPH